MPLLPDDGDWPGSPAGSNYFLQTATRFVLEFTDENV